MSDALADSLLPSAGTSSPASPAAATPGSTTEVGNAFRDLVCDLLRTKYPDLRIEKRLSGTKVDIRFTSEGLAREVWAVECKDYAKPLDKGYVAGSIFSVYHPMLDKREVDRVLIVSRKGLSTDAQEYVDSLRGFSHKTYDELAEALVGLKRYIQHLALLRPTDDTEYIEARLEGHAQPALEEVTQWVRDGDGPGLAILGGYGQGKTSFARRLAAYYAGRHLQDPTERIPILLRLGEVVHETQLEGLFGKEFTARHPSPGYQFTTLEHLNRSGRLVVILDGFDEMKHAMTAADFLANFREFNRLLAGKAKVILLGRPTALPSEAREQVLRGDTRVANQVIKSATYQRWVERTIALFDEEETRHLLTSSLAALRQRHAAAGTFEYPGDFVARRIAEIFEQVPQDLLRRPVHVQLVAEIAANPDFDLRGFNLYRLYEHFIRTMVERDTVQKPARNPISLESRLNFQRELAWWAWSRPGATQGCFFRHEVPPALLHNLPAGNSVDEEGKRNEYIVSTLTEEKESGVLFFAHRSFQEFLVAERLRLVRPTPAAHTEISNFLTPDVIGFLRQAPDQSYLLDWYETLRAANGPVGIPYLQFFASAPQLLEHIARTTLVLDPHEVDVWTTAILHDAWDRGIQARTDGTTRPLDHVLVMSRIARQGNSAAAAVAVLSLLTAYKKDPSPLALAGLVAAVMERCLRSARSEAARSSLTISKDSADFAADWIGTVRKRHPAHGEATAVQLQVDLDALERFCTSQLQPAGGDLVNPFTPVGQQPRVAGRAQIEATRVLAAMDGETRKAHSAYVLGRGETFTIVPVEQRRRSQVR